MLVARGRVEEALERLREVAPATDPRDGTLSEFCNELGWAGLDRDGLVDRVKAAHQGR